MKRRILSALANLLLPAAAIGADHEVYQKDKKFEPLLLNINQGETVSFVNDDDIFHNVFSLSDAKLFDLGSYPKGESREVTFDQPGVIDVECAIHPTMKMTIKVSE